MNEPKQPKYAMGQMVRAAVDLYNDGSFPDRPVDELLVGSGEAGEVVRVGWREDTGEPLYLVDFASGVAVGCWEAEIGRTTPAHAGSSPA